MVQERGVHGLPNGVIAAERKRDVADAAAYAASRQRLLDLSARLNEREGVLVVLLNTCGDGKNVGIEDDVLW